MYQVNINLKRKEGSKPSKENYLVEAISLTGVEVRLTNEFKDMEAETTVCKKVKFQDIFETGEGRFYQIKVAVEDIDSKVTKEVFIQEASDELSARENFRKNVKYGEITDFNETNLFGIIR